MPVLFFSLKSNKLCVLTKSDRTLPKIAFVSWLWHHVSVIKWEAACDLNLDTVKLQCSHGPTPHCQWLYHWLVRLIRLVFLPAWIWRRQCFPYASHPLCSRVQHRTQPQPTNHGSPVASGPLRGWWRISFCSLNFYFIQYCLSFCFFYMSEPFGFDQ